MTKQEALDFLSAASKREHRITYGSAGGGHGEGGPFPCIISACSCVRTVGWSDVEIIPTRPCDCGASKHNQKVWEAIQVLR